MPDMILNRNYTLRSVHGHIVNFKTDQKVSVALKLVPEAIALGAVLVQPRDAERMPEGASDPVPAAVLDVNERRTAIRKSFDAVLARGARGDFTASGHPHVRSLSQIVGFDVDARERDALWQEYTEEREAEKANRV